VLLFNFFAYGIIGWVIEVIYTGLHSVVAQRDPEAVSTTYLWSLPIYGLGGLALEFMRFHWPIAYLWPWWRFVLQVFTLFAIEYLSGAAIKRLIGSVPWNYNRSGSRWSIDGCIRLDMWWCWGGLGIVYDYFVGADLVAMFNKIHG
jgi:uncharacterized membrane protein